MNPAADHTEAGYSFSWQVIEIHGLSPPRLDARELGGLGHFAASGENYTRSLDSSSSFEDKDLRIPILSWQRLSSATRAPIRTI
jgi:hypothetical protein